MSRVIHRFIPRFRHKRAQVALEYMHTYGWTLFSILALLGGLYYYNMTHGDELMERSCIFFSGITCLDILPEETSLSLVLVNGFGFTISNLSFSISGTCNATANTTEGNPYGNPVVLLPQQQAVFIFECQNLSRYRISERMTLSYRSVESDQLHTKVGSMMYYPGKSG
jgi:hypothetical protein